MGLVPMFHGYGLLIICMCLSIGSKVIVLKYFDEELFLKSIEAQKVCIQLYSFSKFVKYLINFLPRLQFYLLYHH